jgi:hypothetical protein
VSDQPVIIIDSLKSQTIGSYEIVFGKNQILNSTYMFAHSIDSQYVYIFKKVEKTTYVLEEYRFLVDSSNLENLEARTIYLFIRGTQPFVNMYAYKEKLWNKQQEQICKTTHLFLDNLFYSSFYGLAGNRMLAVNPTKSITFFGTTKIVLFQIKDFPLNPDIETHYYDSIAFQNFDLSYSLIQDLNLVKNDTEAIQRIDKELVFSII